MNRFTLNGSSLNGVVYGLVLATAAITCSATVTATAVRQSAPSNERFETVCEVVAEATYTHTLTNEAFLGQGDVYASLGHDQKSNAAFHAGVNILGYVLRSIEASASLTSGAGLIVVVASTQGTAEPVLGTVGITSVGTRVQSGVSSVDAISEVAITAAPVLIRQSETVIDGGVKVRAEPHLNQEVDAYTDFIGFTETTFNGIRFCLGYGDIAGNADGQSLATTRQPGLSNADGSGVVVTAEPKVKSTLLSNLLVSAEITATAYLDKLITTNCIGTANVVLQARQKHTGKAASAGSTSLVIAGSVNSKISSQILFDSDCSAEALRVLVGEVDSVNVVALQANASIVNLTYSNVINTCDIEINPEIINIRRVEASSVVPVTCNINTLSDVFKVGVAMLDSSANLSSLADVTFRQAEASLTCSINLNSFAVRKLEVSSICNAAVDILGDPVRFTVSTVAFNVTGLVYADTVSNPASFDPEERTFVRPASTVDFYRAFIESEFKRAA